MADTNLTGCTMVIPTRWNLPQYPLDLIPCPTIVTYAVTDDGDEMRTEVKRHKEESLITNPNFVYCTQCLSILSI